MNKYELLLILPGTLDEKQAETRAAEMVAMVKEYAEHVELTTIGKNRLAYPIKQIRYGYFYTLVFSADPAPLKVLETKLSLLRDVLRTMVTNFNTTLTATQKIAYSMDNLGATPLMEKAPLMKVPASVGAATPVQPTMVATPDKPMAEVIPHSSIKPDPLDMEEITKKLDEILSGDNIIPGV